MSFHSLKNHRSKKYLEFIRTRACVITGLESDVVSHHVRCLGGGGTGIKPSDYLCVPLIAEEHARLHAIGEKRYWGERGISPVRMIAMCLLVYFAKNFDEDFEAIKGLIFLIAADNISPEK